MGRPKLTEYLLKLATDADELEKYEYGPKKLRPKLEKLSKRQRDAELRRERDALLRRAGVTPEQRRRVLTGNSRIITETVIQELARYASTNDPMYGTGLAIVVPIGQHLQTLTGHLQNHVRHHHARAHLQNVVPNDDK
ncbi:MAG TPA: hypothetical protein VEW74_09260 [Candidatus Nitrosotalea sp.]|nr:hypothetical protein [Candidatus Nitrosotalea sp.]